MHLLIPFAVCSDPASRQTLRTLQLPRLQQLLARLSPAPLEPGTDEAPAMPHEKILARALGIGSEDPIPWAAMQARNNCLDTADTAWAFIAPCHWQVGQAHVTLDDPQALALSEEESRALLAAMQPYFEEDGITLIYDTPLRWLARGEVFRHLITASLDRVLGQDVSRWLPAAPALRRLQSEMQMLLYTLPLNDARSGRGLSPVNSFWIHGSGALHSAAAAPADAPIVPRQLADAALRADWATWGQAWLQLDATACAALLAALDQPGGRVTLTLCGEHSAQTFSVTEQNIWTKIKGLFERKPLSHIMDTL